MSHTKYVSKKIDNFILNDTSLEHKCLFIKHYNTLSIGLEEVEDKLGKERRKGLLYHSFAKSDIKEPYEPFMSGIRYYYRKFFNNMSVEEFVETCDVYYPQRSIFISYIATGHAKRYEPLIISETKYEKERFKESITNCYNYIAKQYDILIVLDRLQLAGHSTLSLLDYWLSEFDEQNFRFLVILNDHRNLQEYEQNVFDSVISCAERHGVLYEWGGVEESVSEDFHVTFIPKAVEMPLYMSRLKDLYEMLAFEDAQAYMKAIYENTMDSKNNVNKDIMFQFFDLFARTYYYLENANEAIIFCEKMLGLFVPGMDRIKEYRYNFVMSMCQVLKLDTKHAVEYAQKALQCAILSGEEDLITEAKLQKITATYAGWKDSFMIDFEIVRTNEEEINLLKDNGYYVTLCYYLTSGTDNDVESIEKVFRAGEDSQAFKESIAIGMKLDNKQFINFAYTKYIILFSEQGHHKYVNHFYNEKKKLLESASMKERNQLANQYLGIGYNEIISEDFNKANESFNDSMPILYENERVDSIADGIYNMSVNGICCQDYASVVYLMHGVLSMIKNLGTESIKICDASKLYGILAIGYLRVGNDYRCEYYLDQMKTFLAHLLVKDVSEISGQKHEDLFLYFLVKAAIEYNEEEYREAYRDIKIAKIHYDGYLGFRFYTVVEYIRVLVPICDAVGDFELKNQVIEESIAFCKQKEFSIKLAIIEGIRDGHDSLDKFCDNSLYRISLERLIALTRRVGLEKKLSERKKDVQFLSSWQELLSQESMDDELQLNKSMTIFQNSFGLDKILILEKDESDYIRVMYCSDEFKLSDEQYESIYEFFDIARKEFVISRTEKAFVEYKKLCDYLGENEILTIVGIPLSNESGLTSIFLAYVCIHENYRHNIVLLNNENLTIMKAAFVQLVNEQERVRTRKRLNQINHKLQTLAITDNLTGLFNRQGFARLIDDWNAARGTMTILYADLDNFKYYNDHFGHEVGDLILQEFSKILLEISENKGYAVRYGGDEFLMILQNVSKEYAVSVAKEIYTRIESGFEDKVSACLKKKVEIPKEYRVSCSIGIATSTDGSSESVNEAMKHADEALYYMKRKGKGDCQLWEDMNEE